MTLVERLHAIWRDDDHERRCDGRNYTCSCGFDERSWHTAQEAASEIERLEKALETAREALEPFATYADSDGFGLDNDGIELPDEDSPGWVYVTNGDFRRAAAAIRALSQKKEG